MRPKKPARNTREYIDRKKENAIFAPSVALCCLDETRRFSLPPTSALHIPNLSEIASSVPEICDLKNWLSFFVFFLFICLFFFPGLDGLPLPTTPSTKKARAGQLNISSFFSSYFLPLFAHLQKLL